MVVFVLFREAKVEFPKKVTLELRSEVLESVNLVMREQTSNIR